MIINDEIPRWLKEKSERKHTQEIKARSYQRLLLFILTLLIIGIAFFTSRIEGERVVYVAQHAEASEVKREIVKAIVTAYTSSIDETDDRPWETASGSTARHGSVACPNSLSFGTHILIAEQEYICDDRMNKRYRDKNHFDIWVKTKDKAFAWGRRELSIEIL